MARFSDDFVRRVRESNDIVQVVESYSIPLRRAGANLVALCPFHNEKTPSFNVNPAEQFFKCFGCDEKGDVITFVQRMERVEFLEAVEILAARAGLPLKYEEGAGPREPEQDTETKKALLWANSKARDYFEAHLEEAREGRRAREYLLGRSFTRETIAIWQLGWAPDRWDGLLNHLVRLAGEHKREKVIEAGLAAGVLRQREDGGAYDAFRGRVMFPILDARSRPIGFGGRVLEETSEFGAKYINTAEGKLFQKRKLLYGMAFAAKAIGLEQTAVVVEGYTDTIMCHQYGLRNAVATLGTSLTTEHVQRLRRYVRQGGRVLVLFDSDEAGERATQRAVRLFMQEDVPLGIVRSLELKDACEYLPACGADRFRQELEKAEDGFHYTLRQVRAEAGEDVSAQSAAVNAVMEVVNLSPNTVSRAMMRREVAATFHVPEEALPRPSAAPGPRRPAASGRRGLDARPGTNLALQGRKEGRRKREVRLLQYMLESADWSGRVIEEVELTEFEAPGCAELAGLIRDAWTSGGRPDTEWLRQNAASEAAAALIADMALPDHDLTFSEYEFLKVLTRFQFERLQRDLTNVNEALRTERGNAERTSKLSQRKIELARRIEQLK